LLYPLHDRTSCADNNLNNGFRMDTRTLPRCNRCALLQIVGGTEIPEGIMITLNIERRF
jgi:hypothetical protein